jgi:hypothetical protein
MEAKVHELATTAARCFETARRATGDTDSGPREDGDEYVRIRDGSPEWVTDLAREAHGDYLPDDWRYQFISEALDAISEADVDADLDEVGDEFADDVDIYTGKLTDWLGSRASRHGYVDEAVEEMGHGDSVMADIARGQYQERREVFGQVCAFLEQRAEWDTDDDTESEGDQ